MSTAETAGAMALASHTKADIERFMLTAPTNYLTSQCGLQTPQ